MSPAGKRKRSVTYWKAKFNQAQSLIWNMAEKSLQIKEIPGLLTITKVKPNQEKTSTTCVTQLHGSTCAKDVSEKMKAIEEEKQ